MAQTENTIPAFPSAEEMQRILRQSGVLDRATIFPDKSAPGMDSAANLQQVQLAHAQSGKTTALEANLEFSFLKKYIPKTVGFLLTLQGLRGLYKSVYFILVEFPQLELALEQHLITTQQINNFGAKVSITAISMVISMVFGMRLAILKTKTAKVISTLIGIGLILSNTLIQQYFNELNSGLILSDFSATFLEKTTRAIEELIQN